MTNSIPTRWVTFGGSTIAVEAEGDEPARLVAWLYRDVPAAAPAAAHHTYRLVAAAESPRFRLYRNAELQQSSDDAAFITDALRAGSCYRLAERSHGGLMFHAGGVAWQGRGVLLPGIAGAGKSTLTAWLLSRGFDYLTDELVFMAEGTTTMQGFTRPLNLKPPYRAALAGQVDFEAVESQILCAGLTDLVPPALFNPASRLSEPPLRLIIFPLYQPRAEFRLTPLTKAQAGLTLMQSLINARNLPEHGFTEIVRLAKVAPAYQLSYGHFSQIAGQIEALLAAG